jgi:F-type H+-transporting ATPase subunit a
VSEQKPQSKRKGCLGCSFPIVIIAVAVLLFSVVSGAVGRSIFKNLKLPSWLNVPAPAVQLPAEVLFHLGPLPVTNTLLTSWISMIIIAVILITLSRRAKLVPSKFQSTIEFLLDWILNLCKDVAGEKNGTKFFPLILTIFLFVMMNAWMALIPGYGTILAHTPEGAVPLLRGANTDFNTPLSIALISFVFVTYVGFSSVGFSFLKQFFNFGHFFRGVGDLFRGKVKAGFGGLGMGFIDAFVGLLELLLYFVRIISFTFRLFGNMTGGEILVSSFLFLTPFLIPLFPYGLELLLGAVQALIFSGLTLVFASMAAQPHEAEHHG